MRAPPWRSGYAVPAYVMAEQPGRGVFVTKQLPRGTIPAVGPDYYARPVGRGQYDLMPSPMGADVEPTVFKQGVLTGVVIGAVAGASAALIFSMFKTR